MLKHSALQLADSEVAELHALLLGQPEEDTSGSDSAATTITWSDFVLKAPKLIQRIYARRAQEQEVAAEAEAEKRLHEGGTHDVPVKAPRADPKHHWCMLPPLSTDTYPSWFNKFTLETTWEAPISSFASQSLGQ